MLSLQPKRKRGRPRKGEERNSLSLQANLVSSPDGMCIKPKRKRGRPRKEVKDGDQINLIPVPKRKRGRPRKDKTLEDKQVHYQFQEDCETWTVHVEPEVQIQESEPGSDILQFSEEPEHLPYEAQDDSLRNIQQYGPLINKTCDVCGNPFQAASEPVQPLKSKNPQLTTCEMCSYYITPHPFDVGSLNSEKYFCDECPKSFSRKDGLDRHKGTHSDERPYKCDICDKDFRRSDKLSEHLRTVHRPKNSGVVVSNPPEAMCEVCGSVDSVISVPISVTNEETTLLNICESCNMTRPEGIKTTVVDDSKLFQCDLCFKNFTRKDHVTRHRLTHLDLKPYECYICQKSFNRNDKLTRHMKSHPDAKPFSCRVCCEAYASREELKTHMNDSHPRGTFRPQVCEVCHKGFRDKDKLMRHLVIHTDYKAYTCELCKKGFKLLESLLLHQQVHLNYKPYECDVCKMTFKVRETYRRHCLIHTTEAQFSCEVCSKSFRRRDKLKSHLLVHVDVSLFTCDLCGTGFKRKDSYNKHRKDIHGLEPLSRSEVNPGSISEEVKMKLKLALQKHNVDIVEIKQEELNNSYDDDITTSSCENDLTNHIVVDNQ